MIRMQRWVSCLPPDFVYSILVPLVLVASLFRTTPLHAEGVTFSMPDKQTFIALGKELVALAEAGGSDAVKNEIDRALRTVDLGELMLLAGRNGEAAAIAEQVRIHLAILKVSLEREALSSKLAADEDALEKERAHLAALKKQLADMREALEGRSGAM